MTAEIETLRRDLRVERTARKDAERRATEAEEMLTELWEHLQTFLDAPLPRKIDEGLITNLQALGERYPYLHHGIIAALARRES
jgi:hypothetical protein